MSDRFLLVNLNNTNTTFALATASDCCEESRATAKLDGGPVPADWPDRRDPFLRRPLGGNEIATMDFTEIHHRQHQDRFGDWHPVSESKTNRRDRFSERGGRRGVIRRAGYRRGLRHAVTFDIVNSRREYVGGVIAPGLRR